MVPYSNSTLRLAIIAFSFFFLCAAPLAMTVDSCQNLSAAGTTYTLNQSVSSAGTCFNVTAANVTLDCNGFTITGSNSTGFFGIYINSTAANATIKNCVVTNFGEGIGISAPNAQLGNLTMNISKCNDLAYFNGTSAVVHDSTLYHYGADCSVIAIAYGDNISVENNTLSGVNGIWTDNFAVTGLRALNNSFVAPSGLKSVHLGTQASGFLFALNNFSGDGTYIEDTNGNNFYNATINGLNQGNLYANVADGSVVVTGQMASSLPGQYIGSGGAGYPYTTAKSLGKLSGAITDNAPLTPTIGCGNLAVAGNIYSMANDVTVNGATCFTFTAPNVTLNCAGHSITGNNVSATNGIYSNQLNTTVQNCTVLGFAKGLYFSGADYSHISDTTVSSALGDGIGLERTSNSVLSRISVQHGDWGDSALALFTASANNIIANSTINQSNPLGGNGIYLGDAGTTNNTFINNTIFQQNSSFSNGVSVNVAGNYFALNNFTSSISSGYYISGTGEGNYFNMTINGLNQGNLYANVADGSAGIFGVTASSILGYYLGSAGSGYPYNATTSGGRVASGVVDWAPLTPALGCGVLASAGIYRLSANVSIDSSTCFNVTAANVTLDCAGYSISGNNVSGIYGVFSNQFNTTIKNCIITNFSNSINLLGATNAVIQNVTANTTTENYSAFRFLYTNNTLTTGLG